MLIILLILFWLSVFLVSHTYLLYPLLLKLLSSNKKQNQIIYQLKDSDLPEVDILLAVFNEEKVIEEKIRSTFHTSYPVNKIKFYIGTDASTDETNEIIKKYQQQYSQLQLIRFSGRRGKAAIINELSSCSKSPVMILTDANVFFELHTIYHLVKHYKNQEIAQVGGNILHKTVSLDPKSEIRKPKLETRNPKLETRNPKSHKGISFQEKAYQIRENKMKYQEGIVWGSMIGAFGGCYSILRDYFIPVPRNYLMDDFYISMNVLSNNKKAINELEANCYEDVSVKPSEEFKRKVRISAGNFQNLSVYKGLLWPPFTGKSFAFLSHKVLRWYTPFFIIVALISNLLLMNYYIFYQITLCVLLAALCIVILDIVLKIININWKLFRFIFHFFYMNLALLVGFIKFSLGVKTNIWQPTERNQESIDN
ncbi:MAG: glycosyltransferase [Cytophagales bacterium]|nr:glycosyltransferase [Cytophagales bacterium]